MTDYSLLERTLADNLSWNRARIKFLAGFLLALFAAKTVNLSHIATFFAGQATADSNYKRIKRFLRFFEIADAEVARLIIRLMKLSPPFVLTIDRTSVAIGQNVGQCFDAGNRLKSRCGSAAAVDGVFQERLFK